MSLQIPKRLPCPGYTACFWTTLPRLPCLLLDHLSRLPCPGYPAQTRLPGLRLPCPDQASRDQATLPRVDYPGPEMATLPRVGYPDPERGYPAQSGLPCPDTSSCSWPGPATLPRVYYPGPKRLPCPECTPVVQATLPSVLPGTLPGVLPWCTALLPCPGYTAALTTRLGTSPTSGSHARTASPRLPACLQK